MNDSAQVNQVYLIFNRPQFLVDSSDIHLKVPRTVPHCATGSSYDCGVITYLLLRTKKTKLRMKGESISIADYRIYDETI